MKNLKRSLRRHHYERKKRRVKYIYRWLRNHPDLHGMYANTMVKCSGPCCGNPRRWWKTKDALTNQEKRADDVEDFGWDEDLQDTE